jgi:hypothetical protein
MDIINRLTEKIDNYANNDWGTSTDVHAALWQDIDNLRNNREKANLMLDWKYKSDFEYTEKTHLNEKKMFELMSWEHSFAVTLLFAYYH